MVGLVSKLVSPGRLLYPQHRWRRWSAAWDRWTSALVSASHPAQASYSMQIKPHTDCIHRTARVGDGTPLGRGAGALAFCVAGLGDSESGTRTRIYIRWGWLWNGGVRLRWLFFCPSCRKLQKPRPHTRQESPRPRLPCGGVSVVNEVSAEYHRQLSQYLLLITLVPMPVTHDHAILLKLGFSSARLLFFQLNTLPPTLLGLDSDSLSDSADDCGTYSSSL